MFGFFCRTSRPHTRPPLSPTPTLPPQSVLLGASAEVSSELKAHLEASTQTEIEPRGEFSLKPGIECRSMNPRDPPRWSALGFERARVYIRDLDKGMCIRADLDKGTPEPRSFICRNSCITAAAPPKNDDEYDEPHQCSFTSPYTP